MKRQNVFGLVVLFILSAIAAKAVDPTELSAVGAMGSGYLTTANAVALGFAILGMGWAGYRVIRKFVK